MPREELKKILEQIDEIENKLDNNSPNGDEITSMNIRLSSNIDKFGKILRQYKMNETHYNTNYDKVLKSLHKYADELNDDVRKLR